MPDSNTIETTGITDNRPQAPLQQAEGLPSSEDKPSLLEEIKEAVPIQAILEHFDMPITESGHFSAPDRPDNNPSVLINDNRRFHDFGSENKGDIVDLVAWILECNKSVAAKWLIKIYKDGELKSSSNPTTPQPMNAATDDNLNTLDLGFLEESQTGDLQRIGCVRVLQNPMSLMVMNQLNLVRKGTYKGHECYCVTDERRANARFRRMDGEAFDNGSKSLAPSGSSSAWPINNISTESTHVLIFEGETDLIAGLHAVATLCLSSQNFHLRDQVAFACMTGSSGKIHKEALPLFKGKRCRLFVDNDRAGKKSATKIAEQLREAGASHIDYWMSNTEGEDLNDYLSAHREPLMKPEEVLDGFLNTQMNNNELITKTGTES